MDKYEYHLKADQIEKLVKKQDYETAAEIADTIDWRRVKNLDMLYTVSEIYEKLERFEDCMEVLNIAYDRAPVGRLILYKMIEIETRLQNFDEAILLHREFVRTAPHDNTRYILKYQIYRGRGSSLEDQIKILNEYKTHEYQEKWAYELATLYVEAGMIEECVRECDELVLWFSEGEYVLKALELKMQYEPLTAAQQEKYDRLLNAPDEAQEQEENFEETEIPEFNADKFSTMNLQAELAANLGELLQEDKTIQMPTLELENLLSQQKKPTMKATQQKEEKPLEAEENSEILLEELAFLEEEPDMVIPNIELEESVLPEESEIDVPELELETSIAQEETDLVLPDIDLEDFIPSSESEPDLPDLDLKTAITPEETAPVLSDIDLEDIITNPSQKRTSDLPDLDLETPIARKEGDLVLSDVDLESQNLNLESESALPDIDLEDLISSQESSPVVPELGLEDDTLSSKSESDLLDMDLETAIAPQEEKSVLPKLELEDLIPNPSQKRISDLSDLDLEIPIARKEADLVPPDVDLEPQDLNLESDLLDMDLETAIAPEEAESVLPKLDLEDLIPPQESERVASELGLEGHIPSLKSESAFTNLDLETSIAPQETAPVLSDIDLEDLISSQESERVAPELELEDDTLSSKSESDLLDMDLETVIAPQEEKSVLPKLELEDLIPNPSQEPEPESVLPDVDLEDLVPSTKPESVMPKIDQEDLLPQKDPNPIISDLELEELLPPQKPEPVISNQEAKDLTPQKQPESVISAIDYEKAAEPEVAVEKQITGQLTIDDILAEWESNKAKTEAILEAHAEQEQERKEKVKQETAELMKLISGISDAIPKDVQKILVEIDEENKPNDEPVITEDDLPADLDLQDEPEEEEEFSFEDLDEPASPIHTSTKREKLSGDTASLNMIQELERSLAAEVSEMAINAGHLTKEQASLFAYFTSVKGMSKQLSVLFKGKSRIGMTNSSSGNLVVTGRQGNGKTTLAIDIVKALQKQKRIEGKRLAKISGQKLNTKDIHEVLTKLKGGALIIESAGGLSEPSMMALSLCMEGNTGGLLIILEDSAEEIDRLFLKNKNFASKFDHTIEIPTFTNDELVAFGKSYAMEQEYVFDEFGILALYDRIGCRQTIDHLVTVAEVKEIIDSAITHAEKGSVRHLFEKMTKKSVDEFGNHLLREDDFAEL